MYIPESYRITDASVAIRYITNNPFGLLITQNSELPDTTLLPFMVSEGKEGDLQLFGHMAANKQQSNTISDNLCKVIFTGPHCYISPEWYSAPDVPTWNYIAVEVSGSIRLLKEEDSYELVKNQMRHHEGIGSINKRSESIINSMMAQILCFVIRVDSLEMCVKMSQKKSIEDIRSIVNGLRSTRKPICQQVAEIMEDVNLKGR